MQIPQKTTPALLGLAAVGAGVMEFGDNARVIAKQLEYWTLACLSGLA